MSLVSRTAVVLEDFLFIPFAVVGMAPGIIRVDILPVACWA